MKIGSGRTIERWTIGVRKCREIIEKIQKMRDKRDGVMVVTGVNMTKYC